MHKLEWRFRRQALALGGGAFVLGGVFLPTGWYDALPGVASGPALPIRGITLLKATFVVEGLAALVFAWRWRGQARVAAPETTKRHEPFVGTWDIGPRTARLALGLVTALALALRVIGINADLWLDEIATVVQNRAASPLAVLLTYVSPNNHLLNTELVKAATNIAGEHEWSIRLPAAAFGVATIPVLYWVARSVASRLASVGVALLLAVSYHHIFFSQNARGYASYLFFSLLATGFLVRGLDGDRPRHWFGYVAAMLLDFASLLHGGFVFAGHVVVGAAAAFQLKRSQQSPAPLVRRLATVFGIAALLGLQLYVTMMVQAYFLLSRMYQRPSSGMHLASHAFAKDFAQGLLEGLGPGLLLGAIPAIGIAAYGFLVLLRRKWTLAGALVMPLALLVALVALRSLAASPRFFLLGLPLTCLAVVVGLFTLAERGLTRVGQPARPALAACVGALAVSLVAVASAASLPAYYQTPKQSYRAALQYLKAVRHPGDLVVLIQNAEDGFRYYGTRAQLLEGRDFVALRSLPDFEAVRARGRRLVIVTTLERSLRLELPELLTSIEAGWSPVKTLPATVHEGEIRIWLPAH